jgi:hypothetical protein
MVNNPQALSLGFCNSKVVTIISTCAASTGANLLMGYLYKNDNTSSFCNKINKIRTTFKLTHHVAKLFNFCDRCAGPETGKNALYEQQQLLVGRSSLFFEGVHEQKEVQDGNRASAEPVHQ